MREFILLISINTNPNQLDENYEPRKVQHMNKKGMFVLKFMKMSLYSKDEHSNKLCGIKNNKKELTVKDDQTQTSERINLLEMQQQQKKQEQPAPVTLILTSIKRNENADEDRQLFLANLINEFDSRGIKLRDKYPKIYRDLCMYVEENRPFTPVCLFPRDVNTNNLFMCLIMPNSEAAQTNSWLFNDLNQSINAVKSNNQNQLTYTKQNETIKATRQIDLDKYFCIV
jgi:predicted transposase YdaD